MRTWERETATERNGPRKEGRKRERQREVGRERVLGSCCQGFKRGRERMGSSNHRAKQPLQEQQISFGMMHHNPSSSSSSSLHASFMYWSYHISLQFYWSEQFSTILVTLFYHFMSNLYLDFIRVFLFMYSGLLKKSNCFPFLSSFFCILYSVQFHWINPTS